VDPEAAADGADLPPEAAIVLFPDPGDLVDSVLRRLVSPPGRALSTSTTENPIPLVRSVLGQLSLVAHSHPGAVAAARQHPPTRPGDATALLYELTSSIANALGSPTVDCADPVETAGTLTQLALAGESGWDAVEAILKLLGGYTPAQIATALR